VAVFSFATNALIKKNNEQMDCFYKFGKEVDNILEKLG